MYFNAPLSPRPIPPSPRQSYSSKPSIYFPTSSIRGPISSNVTTPRSPRGQLRAAPQVNNPYFPAQPLPKPRINQLFEILKIEDIDDQEVANLLSRIEQRINEISPVKQNPFAETLQYSDFESLGPCLRISRTSSDFELYDRIDRYGRDTRDRRLVELKLKLSDISELVKERLENP